MTNEHETLKEIKASILEASERTRLCAMVHEYRERMEFAERRTARFAEALKRSVDGLELAYKATKMRALKRLMRDAMDALKGESDESDS